MNFHAKELKSDCFPIRPYEYFCNKMLKILDQGRKQEYIFTDGEKYGDKRLSFFSGKVRRIPIFNVKCTDRQLKNSRENQQHIVILT